MLKNISQVTILWALVANIAGAATVGISTTKTPQPSNIPNQAAFLQLMNSIKMGDSTGIQRSLQSGAAINGRSESGFTPLSTAISVKNTEAVQILLNSKANPNISHTDNKLQISPICLASITGQKEIVDLLLKYDTDLGIHSVVTDNQNQEISLSPVACATSAGHIDIVTKLLQNKASPNKDSAIENTSSPLSIAVSKNKAALIPILCEYKANPNEAPKGISLLRQSFSANDSQIAYNLLQCKANPNWKDSSGVSELRHLVRTNNIEGIRIISQFKPNFKDRLDGVSILEETVSGTPRIRILRTLISAGASPKGEALIGKLLKPVLSGYVDQTSPQESTNLLIDLIKKGARTDELINSESLASYMLSNRTNLYAQTGAFELFEELLKLEKNLDKPDPQGKLLVIKSYLSLRNNPEKFSRILDLFISHGVDINTPQPFDGKNLLDVAAINNETSLKKLLIEKGACRTGHANNSMWKYCQ